MKNSIAQLNQFKIGDVVNIHNKITGEISYTGIIISIADYAYMKDGAPTRFAIIKTEKGIHENRLGTAIKIN